MKDSIRNDMTLSFDVQRVHACASETYSCSCDAQLPLPPLRITATCITNINADHQHGKLEPAPSSANSETILLNLCLSFRLSKLLPPCLQSLLLLSPSCSLAVFSTTTSFCDGENAQDPYACTFTQTPRLNFVKKPFHSRDPA